MDRKPKLEELSLREKISQTAMLGQDTVFEKFTNSSAVPEYIKENPIGTFHATGASNYSEIHMVDGVAKGFYEKDYAEKYRKWIKELNEVSEIPILVASDCEGGVGYAFPRMSLFTTAGGLGAANDEELAYQTGYQLASEAKYAGLNWLWGPPADLCGRAFSVMYNRCYGDSVEINTKMAVAQIKGMQDAGVAANIKHFPGPGIEEYRDPHSSVNVNSMSFDEWVKTQGAIYQAAIDAGVYSIMIGHSAFPAVDNRKIGKVYVPSTLSDKVITELLKGKMGFKGVVVTDGISMRGLSLMYENVDELHKALIKAGNDIILSVGDIEHYLDIMEKAVLSGEIAEERINDACRRVLDMKEKIGLFNDEEQEPGDIPEELLQKGRELNIKVAERSVTLICDDDKKLPLDRNKIKKVVAICPGYDESVVENVRNVFTREFTKRGVEKVEVRHYIDDNKSFDPKDLIPLNEEYDLIIYAAYMPHGMGRIFTGDSFRTIAFSLRYGRRKSIVMSLGSPFLYFDYFYQAETYLNLYSPKDEVLTAAIKGLYGEIEFTGVSGFEMVPDWAK